MATPRALFRRLPPPDLFRRGVVEILPGGEHPIERLAEHLSAHGFERRDLVTEVGEFAVRGGVFDLFPPGEPGPVRLDLFGDTVESIRRFSPDDQRSSQELGSVRVLPLCLFPAGPEAARRLADVLVTAGGGTALGGEAAERIEALRRRGRAPGWEQLLPALAAETARLDGLLAGAVALAVDRPALEREAVLHAERMEADHERGRRAGRAVLAPAELEWPLEAVMEVLAELPIEVGGLEDRLGAGVERIDFGGTLTDVLHGQLPRFPREVETARARGERLLLVSPPEHRERVERLCDLYDLPTGRDGVEIVPGDLTRGFRLPPARAAIFGEPQLFPRVAPARRRKSRLGPFVSGLRDLKPGELVVHSDHGIGQYVGLRRLGGDGGTAPELPPALAESSPAPAVADAEVMEILYADGRTLLLPLDRLDRVQRYGAVEGTLPQLDKLGGSSWERTKRRVKRGLRQMAADLLRLYAERQLARAPALRGGSDLEAQFAAAFDHEETPDQLEAIAAIASDLERETPMDRLLCGDVGFGKTEVAMRAAFRAVDSGHQVAVLAPTTILADQHLETFRRRFAEFPVTIDMISRFRTPKEIRSIRDAAARGRLDILIGTHRLLSKDVELPRLGLLIVDEEQRFGVAQKERLKLLKKSVHVLALSATPVPRTLQLSLAGVRDLSVIETPPRDRMAVETYIVPFSRTLVRQAIEDELERGGQIFYVYNRVQGIERVAEMLRELVPGLRLTIGHGQLPEAELAHRMHAFTRGEHDLLLATTIIENGIDIPAVNTMIVQRADRFGLAQLYQLRGRVGRSNVLAYCFLTVPGDRVLSEDARKRLAAIREFTDLGAGFRVAARDLEIRGAGNLLGVEQSGQIAAVGIETYMKMLEETVRELRGETVGEEISTAVDLPVAAGIPADYLSDASLRMEIYRRIAEAEETEGEILAELEDRFGPPPEPVRRLVELAALKRTARRLRVESVSARGGEVRVRLRRDSPIDLDRLIEMISERPGASFSPTGVLGLDGVAPERMAGETRRVLEELTA